MSFMLKMLLIPYEVIVSMCDMKKNRLSLHISLIINYSKCA